MVMLNGHVIRAGMGKKGKRFWMGDSVVLWSHEYETGEDTP